MKTPKYMVFLEAYISGTKIWFDFQNPRSLQNADVRFFVFRLLYPQNWARTSWLRKSQFCFFDFLEFGLSDFLHIAQSVRRPGGTRVKISCRLYFWFRISGYFMKTGLNRAETRTFSVFLENASLLFLSYQNIGREQQWAHFADTASTFTKIDQYDSYKSNDSESIIKR